MDTPVPYFTYILCIFFLQDTNICILFLILHNLLYIILFYPGAVLKNQLIKGTFILTSAGLLTRLLGFFYRIFLSNNIGAMGMGLYQIIIPLYTLCFSISAGGLHTAVSKSVAENKKQDISILMCALKISLFISFILFIFLFFFSKPVSIYILGSAQCDKLIKIISFAIPLASIHSCISGYYIGLKKTFIPGISQLFEQISRIIIVYIITKISLSYFHTPDAATAGYGLVAGEAASSLFCFFMISMQKNFTFKSEFPYKKLLSEGIPLTLNKVMISGLGAIEAVLIPVMLKIYGLTAADSLSIFGILTGMAFPFIFFPSTITNAVSSMLLPEIAEANAGNRISVIKKTISRSLKYSLILGIFCTGIFTIYGKEIGPAIFNEPLSGNFIMILGWLCPFLYIATTLGSILNGLGYIKKTFFHNIASVLLRILFIIFTVPKVGILGYLWGILASEILCALLHYNALKKHVGKCSFNPSESIIFPVFSILFSASSSIKITSALNINSYHPWLILFAKILLTAIIFFITETGIYFLKTKNK